MNDGNVPAGPRYTRQDFATDQAVRWCPGCGDYSILAQMQKVMPNVCEKLGIPRESNVFVSGIGCSSRFPYYMNTYGFHGIHGRAPAIATGLKVARPELSVWVATGDGDGMSIGGNHLIHAMRRNLGIKGLLFNNRIYRLTKGQYSPTSEMGKRSRSSPLGTIEQPIHPLSIALAAEATFVARAIDTDTKNLQAIFERAAAHRGSVFIEILQNCVVFNDGAFDSFAAREVREDRTVLLEHGKPVVFGKDRNRAIRIGRGLVPEVVELGSGSPGEDVLVHDERADSHVPAYLLARLGEPDFPVALGVFRAVERPTYEGLLDAQIEEAMEKAGRGDLASLLASGDTWVVGP
jgi:2-oxoglutarate/2-oxoacid ferredoxin oxidoreductase subunit beta